jgi:hypothetical protein
VIDFIWNVYQQGEIGDAKGEAVRAQSAAASATARASELQEKVDRLTLACQAMWEILRTRLGVQDRELIAKIEEIDLRDGSRDQRIAPRPTLCPKCSRQNSTRHTRCIYCSTDLPQPHVIH